MYIRKLEYLQQHFARDYLYSGLILKQIDYLPMGTPCIINLTSKNILNKKIKERKTNGPDDVEERNNYFVFRRFNSRKWFV